MPRQIAWKPSANQAKKVSNPLPVPTECPNCKGTVSLVDNKTIYGRQYGSWPFAYMCGTPGCDSYVGIHPRTDIPLGTLANKATRSARKMAKAVFAPKWESGDMTKDQAYAWLAGELGIAEINHCHIGWFDVDTCNRVVEVCTRRTA
jgi:hypothetical protein